MSHGEPNDSIGAERAVFRRAGRYLAVGLGALALGSTVIGWLIAGRAGLLGALVGLGLATLFAAPTSFTSAASARLAPTSAGALLLGSWLVKVALLILVLALLRGHTWYHPGVLFATVTVGAILGLFSLARAVSKGRVPYVDPGRK